VKNAHVFSCCLFDAAVAGAQRVYATATTLPWALATASAGAATSAPVVAVAAFAQGVNAGAQRVGLALTAALSATGSTEFAPALAPPAVTTRRAVAGPIGAWATVAILATAETTAIAAPVAGTRRVVVERAALAFMARWLLFAVCIGVGTTLSARGARAVGSSRAAPFFVAFLFADAFHHL
jgi:hypothetical protein